MGEGERRERGPWLFPINDNTITSRSATNMQGICLFFFFFYISCVKVTATVPALWNSKGTNPCWIQFTSEFWDRAGFLVQRGFQNHFRVGFVFYKLELTHVFQLFKKKKKKIFLWIATRRVSDTFSSLVLCHLMFAFILSAFLQGTTQVLLLKHR